jgi:BirA family biotin operon repressor/biotin-[acetyl-CoA-carboxylase] ligase
VVAAWLAAGEPEVCAAVADEQAAGRGRAGRTWTAPAGAALLVSLGFRPAYLPADQAWRLAAIVSLAMADAAEALGGLARGTIRLKWPNDLVVEAADGELRKLGGVLGETDGLGGPDPRAVVGIGVNADWRAADFPPELASTMTSLHEASGGHRIDRDALLDIFLVYLAISHAAIRVGVFDEDGWAARQATTGRRVTVEAADGQRETATAVGVDVASGALLLDGPGGSRALLSGDVVHVRLVLGAGRV